MSLPTNNIQNNVNCKNFISGCSGLSLTPDEVEFFGTERPWGLILFARNCKSKQQIKQLCQSFRTTVGWNAPVLIDQEGGRVQRLVPPEWTAYPPAGKFGTIYEKNPTIAMRATNLGARLIAYDLNEVGITINCIPTLDIQVEGASDVIGDRSFSNDTTIIEILAKELYNGLLSGGILPVIKHLPGHGRSLVDSHLELPVVHANIDELQADFKPFKAFKEAPFGISAHIIYAALDHANPATISPIIISKIIREKIGFTGCLMTDDISMKALPGTIGERTARALDAGCDLVLHCNGKMHEMREVAKNAQKLTGIAKERSMAGLKIIVDNQNIDIENTRKNFEQLMSKF